MVAQLLRLRLQQLSGSFRRTPWQVLGLVLGILYGVVIAVLGFAALVSARAIDLTTLRTVLVIVGSLVVVAFGVLPAILGSKSAMDPRSFALFGVDDQRLAFSLAISSLTGIPSVVLAIVGVGTVVAWSRNVGTVLVAVVAVALFVVTCSLLAGIATSLSSFLATSRRAAQIAALVGVVVVVGLVPITLLLAGVDWPADGSIVAGGIADVLAWTPLGAAAGAPGDAAIGAGGPAIVKILVAMATVALLWLAWQVLVARLMITPPAEARERSHSGTGWFGVLPGTPTWAVAARSLTYWVRDSRYWITLVPIPFVAVIVVVALSVVNVPAAIVAVIPLPVMCLLLGWMIHDDVAYDSTAIWLHVVSGTSGLADRLGRAVPVVVLGVPLVLVGSAVTAAVHDDFRVFPAVVGVGTALLLGGVGLSSITSVLLPYPVTRPGDRPFQQPQYTGATAALTQVSSLIAIVLIASPSIVLGIRGVFEDPTLIGSAFVWGIVTGVVVLVVGVGIGALVYRARQPELLAAAVRAD